MWPGGLKDIELVMTDLWFLYYMSGCDNVVMELRICVSKQTSQMEKGSTRVGGLGIPDPACIHLTPNRNKFYLIDQIYMLQY